MEEVITYKTKDLFQDYEQWLKGLELRSAEALSYCLRLGFSLAFLHYMPVFNRV